MKLYEISDKYAELRAIQDSENLPSEAIEDTLESLSGELEEKGKAIIAFIGNADADIDALKSHKKMIDQRIKRIQEKKDFMTEYLRENLQKAGVSKIKSPFFSASLGKPSKVLHVDDQDLVPDDYIKVTKSVNKSDAKKALESGVNVPGVSIVEGKPRLTIKFG